MRLTTFLLIIAFTAYIAQGFNTAKCEHVFTQVENATIKIEHSVGWISSIYTMPPTGLHEGKELICVKCFHKQRQVLDYGEPRPFGLIWPDKSYSLQDITLTDSTFATWGSNGGILLFKGDSLIWSK